VNAAAATHVVSMRNRWVGKSGRIRREGMGKRVNFCARSVVTCDSYIDTDEIMVPHNVVARLTHPVPTRAPRRAETVWPRWCIPSTSPG
jgi:DNA-directed RNA polymerase beta' subunit